MTSGQHEQWRPTLLLTRSFVADYVRNPVNLIVLVLVPLVFVVVAARSLADAMELLGGKMGPALETTTAGWAAGFLSSLAMYFQVRSARAADRRMLLAGLPRSRLITSRAATGLLLAVLVSAVALIALTLRTGIHDPFRVIVGTLMFALIYMAIGALVGVVIPNPVNGAVSILLIWMVDVFFGPGGSGGTMVLARFFPTHFVTLWMVDLPSHHAGKLGDFGIALAWVVGAVTVAGIVLAAASRMARQRVHSGGRLVTALRLGLVDLGRNRVLLLLLVIVPVVFILLAKATTPARDLMLNVTENGATLTIAYWFPTVHAGTMTPIAVASLSALAGLFVVVDAAGGDRRLRLAGYPAPVIITARLGVVVAAVVVITVAALTVTALVFDARQWIGYAGANVALGMAYAFVGVVLGPLLGRVAGVFVAFLLPFLDLGIAQSPMLRPVPEQWADVLPGYGWTKVLFDTGLTAHFDQTGPLLIGSVWLVALMIAAASVVGGAGRST